MKLRELGEFGLIARVERAARRQRLSAQVVVGIGDDAAVLRPRAGEDIVVSTDAMVEGVHFRWRTESPRTVGRRALVANLSDLAAMGARPLGFTWALAAPPDLAVSTVDGLMAGLFHEARTYGCPLVGGNVAASAQTSLTLTVLGGVPRGRALRRRGARSGDRVCVTGVFGTAALEVARAECGEGRVRRVATPRLVAGRALAALPGIGACIDVSDGIEADLGHLLEGKKLVPELDIDSIPRPPRFAARCAQVGLAEADLLLRGGEVYELLFTVRPSGPSRALLERRLGVAVAEIGKLRAGGSRRVAGAKRRASPKGFSHFRGD